MTSSAPIPTLPIDHGEVVGAELAELEAALRNLALPSRPSARWLAERLLEGEPTVIATVASHPGGDHVVALAEAAVERIRAHAGVEPALLIADRRYAWAHDVAASAVSRETVPRSRTDRIDDVLTNRWVGVPIFFGLMWLVFTLVIEVSDPFIGYVEGVTEGPLSRLLGGLVGAIGLGGTWVEALLVDGVLAGVGAVLVFVPVLAILYFALGVLEDSGYMARAAYLMDRVMSPIGLSGKSFLPLLLGFGCNVPAVYATRVLDRRRDRIITAMLMPFVSCAARLPVYVLLASVFFPSFRGTVVFSMYVLSIFTVLVLGAVLDRILLREERTSSFVLELPSYRRPSLRVLGQYVGQRVGSFIRGAGVTILVASMVIWLLLSIPVSGGGTFGDTDLDDSAFAATAEAVSPVMAPAGLGSWETTGALLTGLVAKEVMVASFWQVYTVPETEQAVADDGGVDVLADLGEVVTSLGVAARDAVLAVPSFVGIDLLGGDEDEDATALAGPLRDGLDESSGGYGTLAAAALLLFTLLYVPCVATIAAIRHELGGRWAAFSIGASLGLAWVAATAVFQVGRLVLRLVGGG